MVHVSDSERLRLKLDNLVIVKKSVEYKIPLSDISMIVVEGGDTTISFRLLNAFAQYNIVLIACDTKYLPSGIFYGYNQHFRAHKKLQAQLQWSQQSKDYIWQQIIFYKIDTQQDVLTILQKNSEAIVLLSNYKNQIELADKTNREGHAAKVYFNTLFGKKFIRMTEMETDVINAGLNYGYTILRSQLARIVVGYGLNPLLGLFHKNEYNTFNLVDDLIEPFRPIVDLWVYYHLKDEQFLTYQKRIELVNILNIKIKYGTEVTTVTNAMDKYVKAFIRAIEVNDFKSFHCPTIITEEVEKVYEV